MFDSWLPESKDRLPLIWWKGHPIYLAAILALVGVTGMITTILMGGTAAVSWLAFSVPTAFEHWRLWTPLTYVLVNGFSLWVLFGCYMLWSCGEAVERHLGRRAFVRMLLLLVFAAPVTISLLHLLGRPGQACAGLIPLAFGTFVAFATLYPRAKINIIILTLDAWVIAAIFVGFKVIHYIGVKDWISLLLLAVNVGAAHVFIRYEKGELELPSMPRPSKPASATKTNKPAKPAGPKTPTVDDILDKISHKGMHSLTPEERRILDKASEEMKRRAN